MVWPIYYLVNTLGATGVRLASLWNKKAHLFIDGRKNWKAKVRSIPPPHGPRVWFHVSSLGEFEQARPVIEALQEQNHADIILTFFSPSGFEIRKDYPAARVMYLPLDLPGNAEYWISAIKPSFAVFVKYDLWPGYLKALDSNRIPFILIAAHFKPGKRFTSWSLPLTASLLKKSRMIFLQNADHVAFIKAKGFDHVMVAGDTRIDRVASLPREAQEKLPEYFKSAKPYDVIAGSTWQEDERMLFDVIKELNPRIIIAPHDISDHHLNWLCSQLPVDHIRFSQMQVQEDYRIVVMDNIGLLSVLYACGRIAYVGGGFGKSIHNILEPMAHGKPVVFGPAYHNFPEAESMVDAKGGFAVQNSAELIDVFKHLQGQPALEAGNTAKQYIDQQQGATEIIVRYIVESIPFASEL